MIPLTHPDSSSTLSYGDPLQRSDFRRKLTKDESFDEGGKDGPHDFVGALLSSLGLQVHVEKVANPEE